MHGHACCISMYDRKLIILMKFQETSLECVRTSVQRTGVGARAAINVCRAQISSWRGAASGNAPCKREYSRKMRQLVNDVTKNASIPATDL